MKRIQLSTGLVVLLMLLVSCTTSAPAGPTAIPEASSPSPISTAIDATANPAAGKTPTEGSSASASASPTVAPPASPSALPAASAKVGAVSEAVFARAATVRGLAAKGEVPFATLSRDELQSYLVKSFEKDNGREELEKAKALWVMLDLIEQEDDLYNIWLGMLSEQVAGFYDLDQRSMNLVGDVGALSTLDELTLAHEYVHALQDQNFDLGARFKQVKRDGEKALALQALLEGDATLAVVDYASKHMSRESLASLQNEASSLNMQKLSAAPVVLQVRLLFPYQQGTAFAANLFPTGGWAAVNRAYANPPVTSEQIIHPEKYIAGEGPIKVVVPELASALGPQWLQIDSNTIGELGWLVYLAMRLDSDQFVEAAVGWGGDRYALLRSNNGKLALAALSAWDTEEDADEFFYALYDLQDTHSTTEFTLDGDTTFAWTRESTAGYASIKGQQVLLVITSDEATTKKIVERFSGF